MSFEGGPKAAAKLLANLPKTQREKVIDEMIKKDPQMAEFLRKLMVTMDDLQHITVKMLQELLREIDLNDLALALRLGSDGLKSFILSNVSSSMRKDIEDVLLGPPKSVDQVHEAEEKIMKVVRAKLERGEIIIKSQDDEEIV